MFWKSYHWKENKIFFGNVNTAIFFFLRMIAEEMGKFSPRKQILHTVKGRNQAAVKQRSDVFPYVIQTALFATKIGHFFKLLTLATSSLYNLQCNSFVMLWLTGLLYSQHCQRPDSCFRPMGAAARGRRYTHFPWTYFVCHKDQQ